jgi:hypothetical protein
MELEDAFSIGFHASCELVLGAYSADKNPTLEVESLNNMIPNNPIVIKRGDQ